jgi:hypothetical protein
LASFFSSGLAADLILLVLLAEAALLLAWHRRGGRGPGPRAVLGIVLPGLALVLALRFALTGAAWPWVALALVAAFAAHLFDLATRFRP